MQLHNVDRVLQGQGELSDFQGQDELSDFQGQDELSMFLECSVL
jgi:hypothetical protein